MPEHSAPGIQGASPGLEGLKSRVVEILLGGLSEGERPRSLRQRIAKQWVSLRLRRKARQIQGYMEDSVEPKVVQDRLDEKEDGGAEALRLHSEAVAELSEPCRQVYLLRKANGLSHKDIGARLGISVDEVGAYLLQAVEHCDHYVRERMELRLRRPPHLDQRDRIVSIGGRESDKPGGTWHAEADRARGEEVAHPDGRRRAADGG